MWADNSKSYRLETRHHQDRTLKDLITGYMSPMTCLIVQVFLCIAPARFRTGGGTPWPLFCERGAALSLGALLLGGGLAGRLCHPGTDQAPQGQGRVGRRGGGDGERVRHRRRSRLVAARVCGHAPFQTRDLASGLEDLGPGHAPARGKVGLEDVHRLGGPVPLACG
jgi:hypothetical protein